MFKIGDKVRIPKTINFSDSVKKLNPRFLVVSGIVNYGNLFNHYSLSTSREQSRTYYFRDYFTEQDLELYSSEEDYIGGVVG